MIFPRDRHQVRLTKRENEYAVLMYRERPILSAITDIIAFFVKPDAHLLLLSALVPQPFGAFFYKLCLAILSGFFLGLTYGSVAGVFYADAAMVKVIFGLITIIDVEFFFMYFGALIWAASGD